MVQFNELRITPDSKQLIIDVSIKDLSIYSEVFLDSIVIDNQDTYIENGPSSTPVYQYTIPDEEPTQVYSYPGDCTPVKEEETMSNCLVDALEDKWSEKRVRICLTSKDLDLDKGLYFIYVYTKGLPDPSTPCGMDNEVTMGVVCNLHNIYQSSMAYIREVENECTIPKSFINYILRFKAFELALSTGNYILAIKYWNKFFKENIVNKPSICNCPYANP